MHLAGVNHDQTAATRAERRFEIFRAKAREPIAMLHDDRADERIGQATDATSDDVH